MKIKRLTALGNQKDGYTKYPLQ